MIREILQHPDPRLRVAAAAISLDTQDGADLAQSVALDLLETFVATPLAIGLAATQLALPYRVVVVDVTRRGVDLYVMVNPVIVKQSPQTQRVNDGCMSVQNGTLRRSTKRPLGITVEWIDSKDGSARRQKFRNLIAAVIHHELDHLDGKLFIDHPASA